MADPRRWPQALRLFVPTYRLPKKSYLVDADVEMTDESNSASQNKSNQASTQQAHYDSSFNAHNDDASTTNSSVGTTSTTFNSNTSAFSNNSNNANIDPYIPALREHALIHIRKPSDAGLHLKTDVTAQHDSSSNSRPISRDHNVPFTDLSSDSQPRHHPQNALASINFGGRGSFDNSSIYSPPSSISSPMLGALNDVTPLPSPLTGSMELEMISALKFSRSRGSSSASLAREDPLGLLSPVMRSASPHKKRNKYPGLGTPAITSINNADKIEHNRHRSTSEFVPETLQNIRPRNITTPGGSIPQAVAGALDATEQHLQREEYLADRKKKVITSSPEALRHQDISLPTPPPSDRSAAENEDVTDVQKSLEAQFGSLRLQTYQNKSVTEWKPMRILGRGAFSQVILASGNEIAQHDLVAIKVVSHKLSVGSDEERMGTSIKREIEMLKSVSHPCLPQLYSYDDDSTRALLVLNYCPGGDLFELASQNKRYLVPALVQRIFAELVDAVAYLHKQWIVHRDIKLENILLNVPTESLQSLEEPRSLSRPLITLTDLGLSRKIPQPPQSPLLTHACGSADYAAPELLLGQAYDGRATDAWALGVVLYALMEGRLPFDPLPGKRNTSNVKHRIARCDWLWCEYGDQWGDWVADSAKGKEMEGARRCVEGLLKKASRGRWSLDSLQAQDWVRRGISVENGLRLESSPGGFTHCGG